jgi:biopolymer transport protein ExbD
LLIFFLVTTQISNDKGVAVQLPPYTTEPSDIQVQPDQLWSLRIDATGTMKLGDQQLILDDVKPTLTRFVRQNLSKPKYVHIVKSGQTTYDTYLKTYNHIKWTYRTLWDSIGQIHYGNYYDLLDAAQQQSIREACPFNYSESTAD